MINISKFKNSNKRFLNIVFYYLYNQLHKLYLMNYTLNQLQIFLKVTQKESVTKASEELYLSQPAVSIQLKKFH